MKKFYFLSFALCMFLFTACSDDDDDKVEDIAKKISKEYKGNNLDLKVNDVEDATVSATIATADLEDGTIKLENLLVGESEVVVNVKFTQGSSNKVYTFTGTATDANRREVTVKGMAEVNKTLELAVDIKILSPVANTWKSDAASISISLTTDNPYYMVPLHGLAGNIIKSIPLSLLSTTLNPIFSSIFNQIDFELDLKTNGNLIAKWSPSADSGFDFSPGQSEDGKVKYNVVDGKLIVAADLSEMIAGLLESMSGSDLGDIEFSTAKVMALVASLMQGLPIEIEVDGESLSTTISKETIEEYLEDVILPLAGMFLKDSDIELGPITSESLLGFLGELPAAIEKCNTFDIKINLTAK